MSLLDIVYALEEIAAGRTPDRAVHLDEAGLRRARSSRKRFGWWLRPELTEP